MNGDEQRLRETVNALVANVAVWASGREVVGDRDIREMQNSVEQDWLPRLRAARNSQRAMRALEELTPGGSEYVGDVDNCVAHIRKVIASGEQAKKDRAMLRRAARGVPREKVQELLELAAVRGKDSWDDGWWANGDEKNIAAEIMLEELSE